MSCSLLSAADIARHDHMISATFYWEITSKLCGRILNNNTAIPQDFIFEYAKRTQRESNLSIASRIQNKNIAAVDNIVNGVNGKNKVRIPASESGIEHKSAKCKHCCIDIICSVCQYHKYAIREASHYQKGYWYWLNFILLYLICGVSRWIPSFDNMKLTLDYLTKRINLQGTAGMCSFRLQYDRLLMVYKELNGIYMLKQKVH